MLDLIAWRLKIGPKLCPECGAPLVPFTRLSGWLIPEEYLCEACGYQGPIALEEQAVT